MKKPKPECSNCGKKNGMLVEWKGKWYCPGACDVSSAKGVETRPSRSK